MSFLLVNCEKDIKPLFLAHLKLDIHTLYILIITTDFKISSNDIDIHYGMLNNYMTLIFLNRKEVSINSCDFDFDIFYVDSWMCTLIFNRYFFAIFIQSSDIIFNF